MAGRYEVGKTFEAVDGVVFEIASWLVFVPKTLHRVVVDPGWIVPYLNDEHDKEPKERHLAYMPPVLFWLVAGVLPLVALWWFRAHATGTGTTRWDDALWNGALALGAMPSLVAAGLAPLERGPVDRRWMRRTFEAQCLVYTPLLVFGLPTAALLANGWVPDVSDVPVATLVVEGLWGEALDHVVGALTIGPFALGTGWFVLAEHKVLAALLGRGDDERRSERLHVWVSALATVSMVLCIVLAATLLDGPGARP